MAFRRPSLADAIPHKPTPKNYGCFAAQCPMPGAIFMAGVDQPGTCSWHYGVQPNDIPRVTQVVKDWGVLAYEVNEARRLHSGEVGCDGTALAASFVNAWDRLKSQVPGWEKELAPGHLGDTPYRETYADWAKRLEKFLFARVKEAINHRRAA